MQKNLRVVRKAATIIAEAADSVVSALLQLHPDGLKAREEEFTSQLKSEITLHLLDQIKNSLDQKVIKGVKFEVYTFTKNEENSVGADILGILEVETKGQVLRKGYLAQAKVGKIVNSRSNTPNISCSSPDLLNQLRKMLSLSPSSYVFIYSEIGVSVVPALEVLHLNKNSINTKNYYDRSFGSFYEEFFKCYIGDFNLALPGNSPKEIVRFAREHDLYSNLLFIRAIEPNTQ